MNSNDWLGGKEQGKYHPETIKKDISQEIYPKPKPAMHNEAAFTDTQISVSLSTSLSVFFFFRTLPCSH